MTWETTIAEVETAFYFVIEEERQARARARENAAMPQQLPKATPYSAITTEWMQHREDDTLTRDPLSWMRRRAIYKLGWVIYRRWGMEELDRIANANSIPSSMLSYVDHALDGVGRTADQAGWTS